MTCQKYSFNGWPCKRLVACHSLQCFRLVACMVACIFVLYFGTSSQGFLEKSLLGESNSFSNRPDKRLVACYTFCTRKSQLLVQLNVAYILTGFYQCTCNCFWFLFVFLCLFNLLPDAKIMLMFPC